MTTRVPYEQRRYTVHSRERSTDSVPAGRYDALDEAIAHANTVTYEMYVFDRVRWQVVYRSWEEKGKANV